MVVVAVVCRAKDFMCLVGFVYFFFVCLVVSICDYTENVQLL